MRRAALVVAVVAGCSPFGEKAPPLELRYFTPERTSAAAPRRNESSRASLRLGRIAASADLRYAIVHRDSKVELEPYEMLRWTETPDAYARRAIARALFEARALGQAVGGAAPTLDVEVIGFEEVRHGTRCSGRVELSYELRGERAMLARGAIAIERPSRSARIEDVVVAIGAALDAAANELADRVAARLG